LIALLRGLDISPERSWLGVILVFLAFSVLVYRRYKGGKWRYIKVITPQKDGAQLARDYFHETKDF
ncbi:MAG: hypothetical protein SV775_14985, partial [Thermodesulfobacteriota bacterium]|nr:hypothetical protein [Thermodesulfobacteriota bacterium]